MQTRRKKRSWLAPVVLLAIIILLHLFALQGGWVEKVYSTSVYPCHLIHPADHDRMDTAQSWRCPICFGNHLADF
jgi:hypothetical protein